MSGFIRPRGWGEPIATWDYSTGVANVDFTNLGGYRELLIWGDDITFGGASDAPALQLSTDNGSSFLNTGYEDGTATTSYWPLTPNATGEHLFKAEIIDFSHATRKPKFAAEAVRLGVGVTSRCGTRAAGLYNAIRILSGGANNFSAGFIRVYGR